jgi:hypothetical protein
MKKSVAGLVVCLALPVAAQPGPEGPYWNVLPLPQGFTPPITAFDSLCSFSTPTDVWLFSGIWRRWTTIPVGPSATVFMLNDYATIRDGVVIHAFSTRSGQNYPLTITPGAQLFQGPAGASRVSIVRDGGTLYGFSALKPGPWVPLALPRPGAAIQAAVLEATGIAHDGLAAWGFSAYHGTWVPTTVEPGATINVRGEHGSLTGATEVRGFSAVRNTWAAFPYTSMATPVLQEGFGLYSDGASYLMFSGHTGTFVRHPFLAPGATRDAADNAALIVDGTTVAGYAAGLGTLVTTTIPPGSPPTVQMGGQVALVSRADFGVLAFSAVQGRFATVLPGTFTTSVNQSVAFAQGSPSWAYTPLLNRWVQAPAATIVAVVLVRDAAIVVKTDGYDAFASRTGTWHTQPTTTFNDYVFDAGSATFVARDGNELRVFDPKLTHWSSQGTAGNTALNVWRQVVVAHDGARGYGYAFMNNAWDAVTLQGTVTELKANSEIGRVLTNTHLYTYTGHGSLTTIPRYPEFSRYLLRGTGLRLHTRAPVGSVIWYAVNTTPAYTPLGLYGTLLVNPAGMSILPFGTVPASGALESTVPIPLAPTLNSIPLHIQALILPPMGTPWLSNSIAPLIL